ncbi:3-ketoacyl-CoA synthase 3 [Euphorbia peplus]|nr:3-ketoacyl-CoA synthase 3 [Euphorbia peplus]
MELVFANFLLFILFMLSFYLWIKQCMIHRTCYVLAYECFKPTDDLKLDAETWEKILLRNKNHGHKERGFLARIMVNSGIGEEAYSPKNIVQGKEGSPSFTDGLFELDEAIFTTLDKLFIKTGISPTEIDIIVTTVSSFSPSPSLTSRIVKHYKMRNGIKSFNLSGMGCSGSVVALSLVEQLFKVHDKLFAVIVSTECMGQGWYNGMDRPMMFYNLIFRSGGCSILLTNNGGLKNKAMLKLNHLVRTHLGAVDEAYGCCKEEEDEFGYKGFRVSRTLTKSVVEAITVNLKTLLPKVLPIREILRYVVLFCCGNKGMKKPNYEARINLKAGINHFCIHPGGKAIIDKVGESLGLDGYDLEPARMALYRFGNTSSSALWYVLSYMEAKKRLEKGDKVLMIGLGSGLKCNTCVWEVLRNMEDANVWEDCKDNYPPKIIINPFMEKLSYMIDESPKLS